MPEGELRISLEDASRYNLATLKEELGFITTFPMDERSAFLPIMRDWQMKTARKILQGLQTFHLTASTPGKRSRIYTGRSFRSIRHFAGRSGTANSWTGRWDMVGYYPTGNQLADTPTARNVLSYWGGISGSRSYAGALMRGAPAGIIKAPQRGAGGGGTFGGEIPYQRLIAWAKIRGLVRHERRRKGRAIVRLERRAGRPGRKRKIRLQPDKTLVWMIIRAQQRRGFAPDPVLERYLTDVYPGLREEVYHDLYPIMQRWAVMVQNRLRAGKPIALRFAPGV